MRNLLIGGALAGVFALAALVSFFWTPYDVAAIDIAARLRPPSAASGSVLDELIMRANDLVFAFPALLIAILITAVFGPSAFNAILAIGIFNVPVFARLTRGSAGADRRRRRRDRPRRSRRSRRRRGA